MRLTGEQIVAKLKMEGFVFSKMVLSTETPGAVPDLDWNYKDILHAENVHNQVRAVPALIEGESIQHIFIQKVLGIKLPLCVAGYTAAPNSLTYYTTWFFVALVIETFYEQVKSNLVRAKTEYHIGTPPWLVWVAPIVSWILKRNYTNLMLGDIPMRQRRGQLRDWGYTFQQDSKPYTFEKTTELNFQNVILPIQLPESDSAITIKVDTLEEGCKKFLGQSNHLGLYFTRRKDQILFYQRMCMHEGASLDEAKCVDTNIKCPWHGKLIQPLAVLNILNSQKQVATTRYHEIKLHSGVLEVAQQHRIAPTQKHEQALQI